jgi:hypothetical protein
MMWRYEDSSSRVFLGLLYSTYPYPVSLSNLAHCFLLGRIPGLSLGHQI